MAATRFPNKPLVNISGIPMLGHVYKRAKLCKNLSGIFVATCDKQIVDYVDSIGGESIMTKDTHERATDRTKEALDIIKNNFHLKYDGVLMIQGDEPLINPLLLDEMIAFHLRQKDPYITNLISKINEDKEFQNPNVVKIVKNKNNKILYMSRSSIPSGEKYSGQLPMWKQLGLILFSITAIKDYGALTPTELEVIESIDMNRVLENDLKIVGFPTTEIFYAVDTPEDISIVEKAMKNDKLFGTYS